MTINRAVFFRVYVAFPTWMNIIFLTSLACASGYLVVIGFF